MTSIRPAPVTLGDLMREVGKRMTCSKCGSRNVTTTPEQYPGGVIAARARRN